MLLLQELLLLLLQELFLVEGRVQIALATLVLQSLTMLSGPGA